MSVRFRVLTVDDDPFSRDVVVGILGEMCSLRTAASGDAALAIMQHWRPDLVLLDIMMPGRSGYEVCREIRAEARYRATSIILVSAKASVEERLEGYDAGADDYVVKPYVDRELVAKVRVFAKLGRAEEIDRLSQEILALVAHETRTPLNGIIGLSDMLTGDQLLTMDHRENLESIKSSGLRLAKFVHRADQLCRLKRGLAMTLESGSLAEHLRVAISAYAAIGPIHAELVGDGRVNANWAFVDDLLRSLLDNAVRHGGFPIDVTLRAVSGGWMVHVGDRGRGIALDHLRHVFTPLAISGLAHHVQGHGLSLAIGREVAEQHGGFLTAENRPGGGAVFTLGLPAAGAAGDVFSVPELAMTVAP